MTQENPVSEDPNSPAALRKAKTSEEPSWPWRKIESRFWVALTLVFLTFYFLAELQIGPLKNTEFLSKRVAIQGILFCSLVPIFFRLTFNQPPLQFVYDAWQTIKLSSFTVSVPVPGIYAEIRQSETLPPTLPPEKNDGIAQWFALAETSRSLASRIYQRSGVYLLSGVAIAFSGLSFYYFNKPPSTLAEAVELFVWLRESIPRLGMLVFIELVAFFFLRLYRNSMDEFRHFESITRQREEVAALLLLHKAGEIKLNVEEMLKNRDFFSEPRKLSAEQTTEILETRKLERSELAILEKAIDAVGGARR